MEEYKETFKYTYSAKDQEELRSIKQKYMPHEENKMEQLRKLDQSVTKPGMIMGIAVGLIGTLILGLGMTCVLEWHLILTGVVIGILGCIGIGVAYPLYKILTKRQKEKLTPEIMRLIDELSR